MGGVVQTGAVEMAIYSLTGNARSPFHAEPAQTPAGFSSDTMAVEAGRGESPKGGRMSRARITRRDALVVLGAAAIQQAHAEGGLLRATRVDHVALAVGDIDKAMMFYRRLFGAEVLKDSR